MHYIYEVLQSLHEQFPDRNFSIDELTSYFFAKYPDADKDTYQDLFKRASEAEIDEEVGRGIFLELKRRQAALKLSEEAFAFSQGRSSFDKVAELSAALDAPDVAVSDVQGIDLDLDNLLHSAVHQQGLRWRLNFLNKSLGSLRKGDFGFLMKRPETGGTAFLASEVSYMLSQLEDGETIVWINNEEQDNKVALRVYQGFFGVDIHELSANATRYKELWQRQIGNKFQFFGIEYSNKKAIENICARYKPRLIVYDQIDKVQGFDADRDDLKLGAIYEWARNLCKPYGAAVGVTQADGSAEGVKYLNMNHTANSKTSKAAEADFILGIGKSHSDDDQFARYINICKNKLLGDADTNPAFRHGRMQVMIKPEIMRYEDVIRYD